MHPNLSPKSAKSESFEHDLIRAYPEILTVIFSFTLKIKVKLLWTRENFLQ